MIRTIRLVDHFIYCYLSCAGCPTEPGFRQHRMNELRKLLLKFDLDGVWMDYLHWHAQFEDPEPILPETCFSEHCLTSFQSASGIRVPEAD